MRCYVNKNNERQTTLSLHTPQGSKWAVKYFGLDLVKSLPRRRSGWKHMPDGNITVTKNGKNIKSAPVHVVMVSGGITYAREAE